MVLVIDDEPPIPRPIVGVLRCRRLDEQIRFTGLVMADAYRALPLQWWLHLPGLLIPFKVLLIIALVAVFIACPLFRQCSPVQGVCNIDDLVPDAGKPGGERP